MQIDRKGWKREESAAARKSEYWILVASAPPVFGCELLSISCPRNWLHLPHQKCRVFMHFSKTLKTKYDAEIKCNRKGCRTLEGRKETVIQVYR